MHSQYLVPRIAGRERAVLCSGMVDDDDEDEEEEEEVEEEFVYVLRAELKWTLKR